jgi:hypothetical protein
MNFRTRLLRLERSVRAIDRQRRHIWVVHMDEQHRPLYVAFADGTLEPAPPGLDVRALLSPCKAYLGVDPFAVLGLPPGASMAIGRDLTQRPAPTEGGR